MSNQTNLFGVPVNNYTMECEVKLPEPPKRKKDLNEGLRIYNAKKLVTDALKRTGIPMDHFNINAYFSEKETGEENLEIFLTAYPTLLKWDQVLKTIVGYNADVSGQQIADEEAQMKEAFCMQFGVEKYNVMLIIWNTLEREEENTEKSLLYSNIKNLSEHTYNRFKEEGSITSIRITKVYKAHIVKMLLERMKHDPRYTNFKESQFRDWLIIEYGLYMFERKLKEYGVSDLHEVKKEITYTFNDPRVICSKAFNVRQAVLNGRSDEEYIIWCTGAQKERIKDLCSLLSTDALKVGETDVAYICLIYGLQSFFKGDERILVYEHVHHYVGGEFVRNINEYIVTYRFNIVQFFEAKKHFLKEELEIKKLIGISKEGLEYRQKIISTIEKYATGTNSDFYDVF